MRLKRAGQWTGHEPRPPVKPVEVFNSDTDPTLISKQLQRIQEKRMYLSQQQYSRESEERTPNISNQGHSHSTLANILSSEQHNTMVQRSAQIVGSSVNPSSTSVQDSRFSANSIIQEMTVPTDGASRPATSTNQETLSNGQINRRHELLMEVLSQFEKRISAQQIKSFDYSKRQLNSNNGVAFDWGRLPRIGSVHSVQGIVGSEKVQTSPTVGSKEQSSREPSSRMGKIKMAELARLILNGTFDSFLNPSSPEDQSAGNLKTTTEGMNGESHGNEEDSTQVSGVERQVFDPRLGSSSQDTAVNAVPANDSYSYPENKQQQTTANQMVPSFPSFNQSTTQGERYSSNNAGRTPNRNAIENFDTQSIHRTTYNTNTVNANASGNFDIQSNQRTRSNPISSNSVRNYNTSYGNLTTTGSYDTQSDRRTNYNVNISNLPVSTSRNYNLQSNQRTSYITGISNCTSSGSYNNQSNLRTSYNTSLSHQNVSHMINGQTPGVYGPTPVRSSYPRSLSNVPRSSPYIRHPLTSIPMGMPFQRAGRNANREYRVLHPHSRGFQFISRAARTARVEPLSNPTNIVQPSPRATHVITSNTSTSTFTTAPSPDHDLAKHPEHDENSCLDCKLLGTCPIRMAVAAAQKEQEPKDSSNEEPELMITKVTTKDAERGPIERIDVDEWVSSSESLSEPVKVKQEPVDKEEVALNHEEKNSDITIIVNQMRLMAERLLTDDGVLDLGTTDRNEQNSVDKNGYSDSISIQDSVGDSSPVGGQQVTISEVVSAQEDHDSATMSRQSTSRVSEGAGVQDGIPESNSMVSQEAASEGSEETAFQDRNLTDKDIATEELISSEVIEERNVQDRDLTDKDIAIEELTSEVTEESNVQDRVTIDEEAASEVNEGNIVLDPITSIDLDTQTASEVTGETFVQDPVTEDITMNAQLASSVVLESIAQDCVPKGVSMDTQPGSETIEENLDQGQITDDMNVDWQNTFGVIDTDQDADSNKSNSSNETNAASAGHDNRHLASLVKRVKSLEGCISFLKERAISGTGPAESEYDKGDRNYQKYVSLEVGGLTDRENDKTSLNTENRDNQCATSRAISQQPSAISEMTLQDKVVMENLERQLEENQEKLRYQTDDVCTRKMYLKERLFLLRKMERISQKYELMSLQDREAMDKLEKRLEMNQEKLKNQNIAWIRKNCLKARLMILKKIERIRRKHGLPPEEPLSLNEDFGSRNVQDKQMSMEGVEADVAREVNSGLQVDENDVRFDAVPDKETTYESTSKTADSLELPETSAGMNQESLSNEATDHETEKITDKEELTSETLVIGLDNKTDLEERDPVSSKETNPMGNHSSLLGNVVIKPSGTAQNSTPGEAFTPLEDAIKTFVEKPQDRRDKTSSEKISSLSRNNPSEGSSPLQMKNDQENRTRLSFADKGKQDLSDKPERTTTNLITESLPSMNCDEILESSRMTDNEGQTKQSQEIQDLSNEITIIVTDRAIQTEPSNVPRCSKSFQQSSRTGQFGGSANIADGSTADGAGESTSSEGIVRKQKRKSDTREEHVVIKKEKIDSDREDTAQEEKSNNIWDIIRKFSH